MSTDARNSLIAWGTVLFMAVLCWVSLSLMPDREIVPRWVRLILLVLSIFSLGWHISQLIRSRYRARTEG